jgi:hypothetical protein
MDRHRVASRRPRRRSQVNAFASWIEVLGSPTTALSILAMSPRGKTLPAEMPDQPDFVDRLVIQPERPHSLGYQCFHFDLTLQSRDHDPINADSDEVAR